MFSLFPRPGQMPTSLARGQRGAAMVEFVVVGPLITALGLAILQYSMLFFAKGQINHASFMAARAGSVAHADAAAIEAAYKRALIPLYGGGLTGEEIGEALARVQLDMTSQTLRIEILNPTKESFDDHAEPALEAKFGARAIPNTGLALRGNIDSVKASSGQSLQDANLLKLRITHGYEPKVWLMGSIYKKYLQWLDTGADEFNSRLIEKGRVPMVAHITLEMQSESIEANNVSNAGRGNDGRPSNPGDPVGTTVPAPYCQTMGCSVVYTPSDAGPGGSGSEGNGSGGDGNSGGECQGANCAACSGANN
jgi:TadE-like protein